MAKKANPAKTRNDKTRIMPLGLVALTDLLSKSSRPRDKDKIARRIRVLEQRAAK